MQKLSFRSEAEIHAEQRHPYFRIDPVTEIIDYRHETNAGIHLLPVTIVLDHHDPVVGVAQFRKSTTYIVITSPKNGQPFSRVQCLGEGKLPAKIRKLLEAKSNVG
jgi:hypothetical protein